MRLPAKIACAMGLAALTAAPATAATTTTLRLVATIPMSCAIDSGNAYIEDGRIVMSVRRTCNTSHAILLSGDFSEAPSDLQVRYDNHSVGTGGGMAYIQQPERYFDGFDQIVIESRQADREDFIRIAQSIQISIDVN